jgi:hypothetical protein
VKNYDVVSAPEDVPHKAYVDNVIHVGGTQPTGSEIWVDTVAPDPTDMPDAFAVLERRIALLEAEDRRVAQLEARLAVLEGKVP